jgi:hypothetical protein
MSGGGTFVTWYGDHNAAHEAGTCSIGVVTRTEAHGSLIDDADGLLTRVLLGLAEVVAALLHPVKSTTPLSATIPSLRTTSLRKRVGRKSGHRTDKRTENTLPGAERMPSDGALSQAVAPRQRRPVTRGLAALDRDAVRSSRRRPFGLEDGRNRQHGAVFRTSQLPTPLVDHPMVSKAKESKIS